MWSKHGVEQLRAAARDALKRLVRVRAQRSEYAGRICLEARQAEGAALVVEQTRERRSKRGAHVRHAVVDDRTQQLRLLARKQPRRARVAAGAQRAAVGRARALQRIEQRRKRVAHTRVDNPSISALEQRVHLGARLRVRRLARRAELHARDIRRLHEVVEPAQCVRKPLLLEGLDVHALEAVDERVACRAALARELAQHVVRVEVRALGASGAQQPRQPDAPAAGNRVATAATAVAVGVVERIDVGDGDPAVWRERRDAELVDLRLAVLAREDGAQVRAVTRLVDAVAVREHANRPALSRLAPVEAAQPARLGGAAGGAPTMHEQEHVGRSAVPHVLVYDLLGARASVGGALLDAGKVHQLDGRHARVVDGEHDRLVGAHAMLALGKQRAHLLLHALPPLLNRDDRPCVGRLAPRIERRQPRVRLARRAPAEAQVDGHARAQPRRARKERHHREPLEHRALARALRANHDDARRREALEDVIELGAKPVEAAEMRGAQIGDVARRRGQARRCARTTTAQRQMQLAQHVRRVLDGGQIAVDWRRARTRAARARVVSQAVDGGAFVHGGTCGHAHRVLHQLEG